MQGIPWLLASGTAQRSNGSSRDGLLEQALTKVPQGHALYILGSEAPKRSSLHERPASARSDSYLQGFQGIYIGCRSPSFPQLERGWHLCG